MELRARPLRSVVAAGAVSTVLLLAGVPGGTAQAAPSGDPADGRSGVVAGGASGPGKAQKVRTVTLVTGDRVRLDGAGKVTGVERAKGRERVPFSVRVVDGHTRVVPGDAELLLAQGKLDARLFDVTQLVADGYDDAGRGDVPLIATFRGKKAPSMTPFAGAGAKIGRALPVVNGKAMRPAKKRATDFWNAVTATGEKADGATEFTASTAVEKLWLDGRRKANLDKSVPQIGAPTAWAAGYDGTGVKVAVLDTGVDTTHPDLASQVGAQQDFTGSASGTGDKVGHGTHVASTVAGTGAKDGGKYKGVAPGAKILNGKVLGDNGFGYDSEIVAGMEWAVAQGPRSSISASAPTTCLVSTRWRRRSTGSPPSRTPCSSSRPETRASSAREPSVHPAARTPRSPSARSTSPTLSPTSPAGARASATAGSSPT